MPALRALRRGHPDGRITLAAPGWLGPLAALGTGVDRLWPVDGLGNRSWPSAPQLAVNLHGCGPESIADLLGSGAGRLLTHAHPLYPQVGGLAWDEDQHEVARWCRLIEYGGLAADPADLLLDRPTVGSTAPGAVVVHPGASSRSRRWPVDRFADVIRHLADRGEYVVVTGSTFELDLARRLVVAGGLGRDRCLAGAVDLAGLAGMVAEARLVVCGDTGVAHLASAYRTPSVVLFGPTDPARWGPPPSGPHEVLWTGRMGDPHADEPDPGLLDITVPDVLAAIERAPLPVVPAEVTAAHRNPGRH